MAEQKFKVGDRVRYDGRSATIREYNSRVPGGHCFIEFDEDVGFGHNGNGISKRPLNNNRGWWALEHLLSPSPLTIRAGRYYKTRDGRKVGPAVEHSRLWYIDGYLYETSGKVYGITNPVRFDIITEWTEPTAAKAKIEIANDSGGWDVIGGLTGLTFKGKIVDTPRGSTTGFTVPLFDVPATSVPAKKKAIVCLIENGQPKPRDNPHVHATIESAEREARRLVRKYKGKEFVVFEWSTSVKETPAYQHEWQRLAASGLDESAASELSKLSGLSWDTAHAAVLRAA